MNSLLHDFAGDTDGNSEMLAAGNFVPAVDVYEDANQVVLTLEVPGIAAHEIGIELNGRSLTVKGERKFASEQKEEHFTRMERRYGSFVRTFALPASVNTEAVQASSADGVLTITFARRPEAKPRQIAVNGASAAPRQVEAAAA
jgi:HSP20 family protein